MMADTKCSHDELVSASIHFFNRNGSDGLWLGRQKVMADYHQFITKLPVDWLPRHQINSMIPELTLRMGLALLHVDKTNTFNISLSYHLWCLKFSSKISLSIVHLLSAIMYKQLTINTNPYKYCTQSDTTYTTFCLCISAENATDARRASQTSNTDE